MNDLTNPADADATTYAREGKALVDDFRQAARASGLAGRWRGNWMLYYGRDNGRAGWAENLYAEGDQGEKVRMRVLVARNLIQHLLAMTVSTRPVIDPKAKNTDGKSIKQVEIARSVGDHYLKTQKSYKYVDKAAETGLALGMGIIHGRWDPMGGGMHAAPPDEQGVPQPVYRGDVAFSALTPFDVAFDLRATDWNAITEFVVREWTDRHELSARYPELAEVIMAQPTRDAMSWTVVDADVPTPTRTQVTMKSDLVEVFYRYRKPGAAAPQGRMCMFLANGVPLEDGPLPYSRIPLFVISPADVIGTAIGWSPLTSLAPMQEALDKAMSAVATRIFSHSIPNILAKRGANIEPGSTTGGQNFIEYDDDGSPRDPVRLLDMMEIPEQLSGFISSLTSFMEADSGVNSVVRGQPPPGLSAGVAIAQFESMAVQFSSHLEASYAEAIEGIVTWIFEALKTHSEAMPRLIQIVGRSKHEALMEFMGADLEGICRVEVDMGNPLARTVAGRMQIADALRNSGIPMTPEQYLEVMNTGNLESATEGQVAELDLIRQENEKLMDGQQVPVLLGDSDPLHISEHMAVLSNPEVRFDQQLLQVVQEHIGMHIQKHMQGDIAVGIARGMIPPGAAMAPAAPAPEGPPGPGAAAPAAPPPHGGPAAPGGPPQMHAPPAKSIPPGTLPRVMEPSPLAPH